MCTVKSTSSHRRCYVRKGVLRNLAKFTGKHLCQSTQPTKEILEQVFFCEFYKISKKKFFYRTPLGDNFSKPKWPYNQHICWIAKIIIYVSSLYVSIDYVLFVSFISVDLLILNSRGINYRNFDTEFSASLLNEGNTMEEVSLILQDMYPNKIDLSVRYLKCYSAKRGISKRILRNTLDNLVAEAVEEARFRVRHNKVY